jgi:hypothetical protein
VRIVCVWSLAQESPQLVGVLPIVPPRLPILGCGRGWLHEYAVLGIPILDRGFAGDVLEAMAGAIVRAYPTLAALLLPQVPETGPTFALLQAFAARHHRKLTLFDQHRRAILQRPHREPLSSHAAGELRRQRRRLGEMGGLIYRRREDASEVASAMEEFLALEASGWKGRRKSALASAPTTAAFARDMVRRMGRAGKLSIDSLELSGNPIAMGMVLRSGDRAFFWKTAFDETHAGRSPGVLFTHDFTRQQISHSGIAATDSCAIPDHPMIDHLWRERLALCNRLVVARPQAPFALVRRLEGLRCAAIAGAKRIRTRIHRR